MGPVRAVVFDLGGVLVDWNPRHLYRKLFDGDESAMEHFLATVCTPDWNAAMDAGRPFAAAVGELADRHPGQRDLIAAYWERWEEMVPGPLPGAPALLGDIRASGLPVYALSNWSAETWPRVSQRLDFLTALDGIVLSGQIGLAKPAAGIYRYLIQRFALEAGATLFVDDSPRNVEAARRVGLRALLFESMPALRRELEALGVLDVT